ncbi:MAG: flagellar biosynthetic protein FliO [Hyphomicrobiaceae bacterium]
MDILFYLFVFALLALAVVALIWVVKGYANGQSPSAAIFGPRPDKRLGVIEQASMDGRRRLVLVRRDDVEHLIMIGGPVDVVIETGINGDVRRQAGFETREQPIQPVFSRPVRAFGQAGERSADKAAE